MILILFGLTLLPPIFLIVAVRAESFGQIFSADLWRTAFAGRFADLYVIYAIHGGGVGMMIILAIPVVLLGFSAASEFGILFAFLMFGYMCGDMLSSPRALYAFGRDGFLPKALARVHPSFHTPYVAIGVHALLASALAISSSFRYLALLANVAVLTLYFLCCAAALRLVSRPAPDGEPAFTFAGARVIPVAAMAAIAWILAHATRQEFAVLAATLVAAAALYGVRRLTRA